MRITKIGSIPSNTVWVGQCQYCKSTAEAAESELTNIQRDFRDDGRFSWEKCPVCSCVANGYGGMLFYPKKGI